MKNLLILFIALLLSLTGFTQPINFNISKGTLTGKIQTIQFSFSVTGCTCANWIMDKSLKDADRELIFLEPADKSLINADNLFTGSNIPVTVSVTGRFYQKKGYPKDYHPAKGSPEPARVFRYNKIKVIRK